MTDCITVGLGADALNAMRCALSNLVLELRGADRLHHAAVGELARDRDGNCTQIPNALAVALSTRGLTRAAIHAEELADLLGCDVAPVV